MARRAGYEGSDPPLRAHPKGTAMNRTWAPLAAVLLLAAMVVPPDADARVRVRQGHEAGAEGVKVDIPDLPPIDFKGLTNADALTVAISKTALLPAAQPGAKPLANLGRGARLKKLGEAGGYFKVETADKRVGYVIRYAVARGKIDLKPVASTLGTVTAKAATTVYLIPNKAASKVGQLAAGQKVPHLFTIGGFYKVKTPQGKVGYIEMAAGTASAK